MSTGGTFQQATSITLTGKKLENPRRRRKSIRRGRPDREAGTTSIAESGGSMSCPHREPSLERLRGDGHEW